MNVNGSALVTQPARPTRPRSPSPAHLPTRRSKRLRQFQEAVAAREVANPAAATAENLVETSKTTAEICNPNRSPILQNRDMPSNVTTAVKSEVRTPALVKPEPTPFADANGLMERTSVKPEDREEMNECMVRRISTAGAGPFSRFPKALVSKMQQRMRELQERAVKTEKEEIHVPVSGEHIDLTGDE